MITIMIEIDTNPPKKKKFNKEGGGGPRTFTAFPNNTDLVICMGMLIIPSSDLTTFVRRTTVLLSRSRPRGWATLCTAWHLW